MEDITDFLPKYPNINNYTSENFKLFNPYYNDFYDSILDKKEFNDLTLPKIETIPKERGQLLKHQKLVSRFLSNETPYDEILLFHAMGSGKSCTAIGAIENSLFSKNNTRFNYSLVITNNTNLADNFIEEIVLKCTDGHYINKEIEEFEKSKNKDPSKRMQLLRKAVKTKYRFLTYHGIAKEVFDLIKNFLKSPSNNLEKDDLYNIYDLIGKTYKNVIIAMDEVHHIREKQILKSDELDKYKMIKYLCEGSQNRKIILMSGTPMRDSPEEIASLMNLILPINMKMKSGKQFISEYLEKEVSTTISKSGNTLTTIVKPEKVDELKAYFKGRISYLKSMESDVKKIFNGESSLSKNLNHLVLYPNHMSKFQRGYYLKAFHKDVEESKGKGGGIYNNSRQASLFVYPDGLYGPEGFKNHIITKVQKKTTNPQNPDKKITINSYSLSNQIKTYLKGSNNEETIKNIKKYSSKYAKILSDILNKGQNKCIFIYCEFVQGSGSILFSKLLELLGYSQAVGNETEKAKRYALFTDLTTTKNDVINIKNRFNQPDNMFGEYIQIIIGSSIVTEGFSLFNIQQEHIITPHWNYTQIEQSLARGLRVGSHSQLLNNGINPQVDIYQHVSMPFKENTEKSVDLIMYEFSESKDIGIKNIERLIKESAFDCGLTYNRNSNENEIDGSRNCEYQECEYKCDGINMSKLNMTVNMIDKPDKLDYSTFQLYYIEDYIDDIVEMLNNLFTNDFNIKLSVILNELPNYTDFQILSGLSKIINENIPIRNKYFIENYLREYNNVYFLVDNITEHSDILSSYYIENPYILTDKSFTDILSDNNSEIMKELMLNVLNVKSTKQFKVFADIFSDQLLEIYIEASILSKVSNTNKNTKFRDVILEFFKDYISLSSEGIYSSTYLNSKDSKKSVRCLNKDTLLWEDCNIVQKTTESSINMENFINNNKVFGLTNDDGDFKIVNSIDLNIIELIKGKNTGHIIPKGQNCYTIKAPKRYEIYKFLLKHFNNEFTYNHGHKDVKCLQDKDIQYIKNVLINKKKVNKLKEKINEINDKDTLLSIFYFAQENAENTCQWIKDFFESKKLIIHEHDYLNYIKKNKSNN